MYPGKVTVGTRKMIKLGLLTNPENTERQETHKVGKEARPQVDQGIPYSLFRMNSISYRDAQIEDKEGHCYGKDTIAQGSDPLQALPGDTVINRAHFIPFLSKVRVMDMDDSGYFLLASISNCSLYCHCE